MLGRPVFGLPNYRGTYRSEPAVQSTLPLDWPVNRAALRYIELAPDMLERDDAIELAAIFAQHGMVYDIIRFDGLDHESAGVTLLGYDVSLGEHYSPLSNGLRWSDKREPPALIRQIHKTFSRQLNEHLLFSGRDTAEAFRKAMVDSTDHYRGYFESPNMVREFRTIRLDILSLPSANLAGNKSYDRSSA